MNKFTKTISVLMILVFCLGMLAGCGEDEGSDSVYSQGLTKDGYFDINTSDYVKLGDYSKLEISKEDMESFKEYLLYMFPGSHEIQENRAAVIYDLVNIDYSGSINGVAFDNGTATGQELRIGEGYYIGGFEEGIIGHYPGETFTIDVTFPDEYPNNPDLAGKQAQFQITLNSILEDYYYESITDEFVVNNLYQIWGVMTVEELDDFLIYSEAYGQIVDNSEVADEVPESMIEYFTNVYISNQSKQAEQWGMTLDDLLTIYGTTVEKAKEEYRDTAESTAREALVYQAIAQDQGFKISNEDLRAYFLEKTGNSYYTDYKKEYGLPYLKYSVITEKVRELIDERIEIN